MKYIKLTNRLINMSHVSAIVKRSEEQTFFGNKIPEKYKIHLSGNSMNGILMFGSGFIESNNNVLYVCSKDHPEDFQIIEQFLTQHNTS